MNYSHRPLRFLEDGCTRALAAIAPKIRAEVEREFREQLAAAHWIEPLRLRHTIRREVQRRVTRQAPGDALY